MEDIRQNIVQSIQALKDQYDRQLAELIDERNNILGMYRDVVDSQREYDE